MKRENREFIISVLYFLLFFVLGERFYLVTYPVFLLIILNKVWYEKINRHIQVLFAIHFFIFIIGNRAAKPYFYFLEIIYLLILYFVSKKLCKIKELLREEINGERYKDLVENVDGIIAVLNLKGEITYLNNNFRKKINLENEYVLGKNICKIIVKEDRNDFSYSFEKLKELGNIKKEFRIRDKFDKIHYIKAAFKVVISENKIEIFAIMEDISDLKEKEEQLKQMYTAVEHSSSMILVADHKSKITYVNPKYLSVTEYEKEDIIGKNIFFINKKDEEVELYDWIEETVNDGKEWIGDILSRKKNGKEYWEYVSLSAIRDDENGILGYIKISEDVTYQKEMEQKLIAMKRKSERLNSAKSEFLASMSHEIRTPLNGIIGFVDYLVEMEEEEEKLEILKMVKDSGINLLTLINYILDLSKIEAGKVELENTNFSMEELIKKVIKKFEYLIKDKELDIEYNFKDNIGKVYGDKLRIEQILSNLLSNAIKFTEKGKVVLSIEKLMETKDEVRLYFEVADTGIGITKEKADKIFKKFEQAEEDIPRRFGGTGLGLAIVKNLIDLMRGDITVRSKVGNGSIFAFDLYLKKRVEENIKEDKRRIDDFINHNKKLNVIVAEDNKVNQKLMVKLLEDLKWNIYTADNGIEVLNLMEANEIDLILMDIQMPEMDGIEAMKEIRKKERGKKRKTSILVHTAYAMKGDEEEFLGMGADAYISKPISKQRLHEKIFEIYSK